MSNALALAVVGGFAMLAFSGGANGKPKAKAKAKPKALPRPPLSVAQKVVKRAARRPAPPAKPPKPNLPSAKPPLPKASATAQPTSIPEIVRLPIGKDGQMLELDLSAPTPEQQTAMDQFLKLPSPAAPAAAPKRPAVRMGPVNAKRTPKQAALALLAYVKGPKPDFGVKGRPSAVVRAAQIDMGVTPDGIYGPTTRNAGRELTGKAFPPRR